MERGSLQSTNADVVCTNADVVCTNADVVYKNVDVVYKFILGLKPFPVCCVKETGNENLYILYIYVP